MTRLTPAIKRVHEAVTAALEHDETESDVEETLRAAFLDHRMAEQARRDNAAHHALNDMKEKVNV